MKKPNPTKPATSLTIAGVTYDLLFDLEAVALAEDLTDKPLLTGLRQRDLNSPKISMVQDMLFACIHTNHPDLTHAQVKNFVTRRNWAEVWTAVLNTWTAGLAEPDLEEDAVDADPTTDQR